MIKKKADCYKVDELWDSMCQTAVTLISKALHEVANAEVLLKIRTIIALFIQTMDVIGSPASIKRS